MAKARKLPSGTWRIIVSTGVKNKDGKYIYKSFTAKSKKECEALAAQYLAENNNPDADTIGLCIKKYIDLKKPVISPATVRGYNSIYREMEKTSKWFFDLKADKLTEIIFQKYINEISANHKAKTVANYHGLIVSALKMEKVHVPDINLPAREHYNGYIPTDADISRLLSLLKGTEMEIIVLLAALGPMRRGEIRALEMTDINGNVIHISKAFVEDDDGNEVSKVPKTYDSDRFVEYPQYVIDRINEQGFVCNMPLNKISHRFDAFLEKNGFTHFRFHDLRHYGASILHAIGMPDSYIMERGGWKTDNVMKSVYRHTISEETKKFNEKANEHFNNLFNSNSDKPDKE